MIDLILLVSLVAVGISLIKLDTKINILEKRVSRLENDK